MVFSLIKWIRYCIYNSQSSDQQKRFPGHLCSNLSALVNMQIGPTWESLTQEAGEGLEPEFFTVSPPPPPPLSTLRHTPRTVYPGKMNRQEELYGHPISVWKTIPTNSRLLTETRFVGKSTAWPPSSLSKFQVREQIANLRLLNIFPKIITSKRFAFS